MACRILCFHPTATQVLAQSTNSTPSVCGTKSAEEITLEASLQEKENELLTYETLLNQTQASYRDSLDDYNVKSSAVNTTFSELVPLGEDLDLNGNEVIEHLNSYLNVFEDFEFDYANHSSTGDRYNTTVQLFLAQNETYFEALEGGDPVVIEQAEREANDTLRDLVR